MLRSPLMRILRVLLPLVVGIGLFGCASSEPAQSERETEDDSEETVNVAYGKQKKDDDTSASSTVTPDESERDAATDVSDLLRGETAGVRVEKSAGGVRITIRGITSINSDTEPLYVVDDMVASPNPNGTIPVHPQDVKSITVLKDAAATSMYGSRGANGVIIIETRD